MNRRDDKTFLCEFDFGDRAAKGISDKARDGDVRSLGSGRGRTNGVCEQGRLVYYGGYLHRRKSSHGLFGPEKEHKIMESRAGAVLL